jgi:hypothetical protein
MSSFLLIDTSPIVAYIVALGVIVIALNILLALAGRDGR